MNTLIQQKISNYFKDKPVIRAFVFGSYARAEEGQDSDIDILVELDQSQSVGLEFIRMGRELQDLLGKNVDLVSANGLSKYIQPIIEGEKKLIYAR
ncbi:MAG: nucleotidyltransferase domain-containing protein [Leeuwenhoekiella sp.]